MAKFINRPRIEMRATLELDHAEIAALNELTRFGVDKVQAQLASHFTADFEQGKGKHAEGLQSFLQSLASLGGIRDLHNDLMRVADGTHEVKIRKRDEAPEPRR